MKLSALGIIANTVIPAFIGKPELSPLTSSDGEEYFVWKLKEVVKVRCSVDSAIEPFEANELYLRKSLLDSDLWVEIEAGKPEEGLTIPGYKVDFSKSHEVAIFQETTIREWTRTTRGERNDSRRKSINDKIRERMVKNN